MKLKIYTVIVFIFSISITQILYAQSPAKWGPWETDPCYQGISFSVLNMGLGKNSGGFLWGIRFKNNYSVPVQFRYKLTIGEESKSKKGFWQTKKIKPGETWIDGKDMQKARLYNSASGEYFVYVDDVCFGDMQCWQDGNCYADCDEVSGKANQPCGFGSSDKKIGNAKKEVEDTLVLMEGKWQSDDKKHNIILEYNEDGLFWRDKNLEQPAIVKKLEKGIFGFEANDSLYFLQYVKSQRLAYWENNKIKCYFNWISPLDDDERINSNERTNSFDEKSRAKTEEEKPISFDGEWKNETGSFLNVDLTMTNDGINWTIKGRSDVYSFKRISSNTFMWESQNNFAFIEFMGSNRFRYSSNGNVSIYYSRLNPVNGAQLIIPDLNSVSWEGEWERNDKYDNVYITMTGDGLNWLANGSANVFSFKKIASGTFRINFSDDFEDIKMINENTFSWYRNDTLKYFFIRKNPITEISNENAVTYSSVSVETDAIKLAGYTCTALQLQGKSDKNPSDQKLKKDLEEAWNKADAFTLEAEKKYADDKDRSLFETIFNKEMEKCK